jgi:hypothetical protein
MFTQAPLETLVILYFGIRIVGVAFLSAMAALALLIPLQVITFYYTHYTNLIHTRHTTLYMQCISSSDHSRKGLIAYTILRHTLT